MKNLVARILVIGTALAGAIAVNAADKTITANVPFNFYMGSTVMPQGAYRVEEFSHGAVVALRTSHASMAITTFGVSGKSESEPARLVFRRYGETYFLTQIWAADGSIGRALPRSAREKELAQNGSAPTLAVIQLAVH
jgi:hypothetical protein